MLYRLFYCYSTSNAPHATILQAGRHWWAYHKPHVVPARLSFLLQSFALRGAGTRTPVHDPLYKRPPATSVDANTMARKHHNSAQVYRS
jgi:hypothetical protein